MLVRLNGPKRCSTTEGKLDDVTPEFVDEFRCLGLIVSADCTDDKDVAQQTR